MSHELPLFLALLAFIPCSTALTNIFHSTSFSCTGQSLKCSGDAYVNQFGALELTSTVRTSSSYERTGWAFYDKPITLYDSSTGFAADFESNFSFEIAPPIDNACYGDGLAFFVVHADWTPNPAFYGGGLGIFNSSKDAENSQIIAIEFDTYNNSYDPIPKHMGIDVNSLISNVTANWTLGGSTKLNGTALIRLNSTTATLSSHLVLEFDVFPRIPTHSQHLLCDIPAKTMHEQQEEEEEENRK